MNLQRRQILKGSGAALLALPLMAGAQAWPARPIRLVVPFPPGGLVDTMARLIGPRLAQELGQPVVIDNKPGAGGNLGAAEVARATPDGYTLLMASPPLTISPALYATLPYRPEQIVPIGLIGRVPNVLLVNPEAIFEVSQLPTREVLSVKLKRSSGNPALDEAIERAIRKSSPLPAPDDPSLFQRDLTIKYKPLEE